MLSYIDYINENLLDLFKKSTTQNIEFQKEQLDLQKKLFISTQAVKSILDIKEEFYYIDLKQFIDRIQDKKNGYIDRSFYSISETLLRALKHQAWFAFDTLHQNKLNSKNTNITYYYDYLQKKICSMPFNDAYNHFYIIRDHYEKEILQKKAFDYILFSKEQFQRKINFTVVSHIKPGDSVIICYKNILYNAVYIDKTGEGTFINAKVSFNNQTKDIPLYDLSINYDTDILIQYVLEHSYIKNRLLKYSEALEYYLKHIY